MPDLDSVVAAALITAHTTVRDSPHFVVPVEKPRKWNTHVYHILG